MQKKCNKNLLSHILSTMLIVAMAFSMTACGDSKSEIPVETDTGDLGNTQDAAGTQENVGTQSDVTIVGEGATVFHFVVVDGEGNETAFEIHTDKTIVGDALLELNMIAGDSAEYGLYVKTVNGITVDYDTDGKYWAFYVDGEYGMSGVDATSIVEGATYSFKVE